MNVVPLAIAGWLADVLLRAATLLFDLALTVVLLLALMGLAILQLLGARVAQSRFYRSRHE